MATAKTSISCINIIAKREFQNINIDSVELEHNIAKGQCTGSDLKRKTCCTLSNKNLPIEQDEEYINQYINLY